LIKGNPAQIIAIASITRGRTIASSISQNKERFEGSIKTGNEPIAFNNDDIQP